MFQTRFSVAISRLFRFRRRRNAKPTAAPANVARASFSAPPHTSKLRRPVSLQPKSDHAASTTSSQRRPRSTFVASLLSPISQSPPASPNVSTDPSPPVIIIGRADTPSESAFPADATPSNLVDAVSPVNAPPASNPRCVSFQLPTTTQSVQDHPETPLSTCSTLVIDAVAQAEAERARIVPFERPPVSDAPASASVGPEPATADGDWVDELPGVGRSKSRKARTMSLFTPQPVRANASRFSLPARPKTTSGSSPRESRRESKRMSTSGASTTRKEKLSERWSRELNKPETQEVLRILRGL